MCDWESTKNQSAIRKYVGLLFRGCSCTSCCSCVKKGCTCGPVCRCKKGSNTVNSVANNQGTHQQSLVEVQELEEKELLHVELLRMEYGEEVVLEEETDEANFNLKEEDEENEYQRDPEKQFNI